VHLGRRGGAGLGRPMGSVWRYTRESEEERGCGEGSRVMSVSNICVCCAWTGIAKC
jgi:hypothetical protein